MRNEAFNIHTACLLLCLASLSVLLVGCTSTHWQSVTPHYDSVTSPWQYEFHSFEAPLRGLWGLKDGSQLWAVGVDGVILHYSKESGAWVMQNSSTGSSLSSIFGTSD